MKQWNKLPNVNYTLNEFKELSQILLSIVETFKKSCIIIDECTVEKAYGNWMKF